MIKQNCLFFFFSSRRRHTRLTCDWSSDVCSSDLDTFQSRYINDGFSGGEKKRAEILQMAALKPEIAVLDETDSGLDIDSIKYVAESINGMRGPDLGVLIITHYTRILEFIRPDVVHVLVRGQVVQT